MFETLQALLSPAVLGIFVPLSAIIGFFYYINRRQELKAKLKADMSAEDKQMFLEVLRNNKELSQRVENLESIVTSLDQDLIAIPPDHNSQENSRKVEKLS